MDTISPTAERVARAQHGIDEPEVSQAKDRRTYVVRDIWSNLRRLNQISEDEAAAGRKFSAHMELAYRGRAITPSYGQRHAEGTPVSQLSGFAAEADMARAVDYYVLHQDAKAILPPSARMAMMLACDGMTPAQIGRLIAHYRDDNRAVVAAVMTIKSALELLARHYGIIRDG
jgi:hypothetical protein